ncbi:kinase-like domain-containing protein [Syncephalis plumigaleata]|nr:kinase-like domain-containing protein [Syncephalis plumigaleata]
MNEMRVYNKIMEAQRANPKDGKYVVDLLDAFPINTLNNDGNSLLYSLPPQVQNDPELMKSCCFITRLAGHKNLLQYNEELPVQNKNLHLLSVMIQVLKGTKFLNDAGVIHGDLRPENIMIETMENGAPKATLINFTSSLVFDVNSKVALTSRTIIGSSQYAPFEALASQTYDLLRSETWKIGAAFYHSLAGMTLYKKVTNGAYFLSMAKRAKHFAAILRDSSFTLPPVTNDQALMQQCRLLLQQLDILLTVGQHRMTPKEALAAIAKNLINVKLGH